MSAGIFGCWPRCAALHLKALRCDPPARLIQKKNIRVPARWRRKYKRLLRRRWEAALADEHTFIVQMVGFSNPKWQLPRYLETMEEIGLREMFLPKLHGEGDGRLWRSVRGQRWYIDQRGNTPGSREVVLLHVQRRSAGSGGEGR